MEKPTQPDPESSNSPWTDMGLLLHEHRHEAGSSEAELLRRQRRDVYDDFNRRLNEQRFGRFAHFLNYGYIPNAHPSFAVVTPREGDPDANSRRLVQEVIGDCPVSDRDVMDVSCGRGGVAVILQTHFAPRSYYGVDLSSEAIHFCRKQHGQPGYRFEVGDAQSLPVGDVCCDVLINLEASHNYPNIDEFFREVFRVLRPGGWFLYADLMGPEAMDRNIKQLCGLGFEKTRDQVITSNVLLSCQETGERRLKIYKDPKEREAMAHFLAAPGSLTYRALEEGAVEYRLFRFQKPPV